MKFKFCPECGYKFEKECKFCPECGYKLTDNSSDVVKKEENDVFGGDFSQMDSLFDEQLKKKDAHDKIYLNKLKKAKVLALEEKYDEAEKIYNAILDEEPLDINAYAGLLRVYSKNYTEFYNERIEENVGIVSDLFTREQIAACPEMRFSDFVNAIGKKNEERQRDEKCNEFLKELSFRRDGKFICFGNYEQTKKSENDGICEWNREPIRWQVLEEENGVALLLSEKLLFYAERPFGSGTFKDSDLCNKYLPEFLNEAFTDFQKAFIKDTVLYDSENYEEYTLKAWILSEEEFNRYKERITLPKKTEKVKRKEPKDYISCTMLRDKHYNKDGEQTFSYVNFYSKVVHFYSAHSCSIAPVIRLDIGMIEDKLKEYGGKCGKREIEKARKEREAQERVRIENERKKYAELRRGLEELEKERKAAEERARLRKEREAQKAQFLENVANGGDFEMGVVSSPCREKDVYS